MNENPTEANITEAFIELILDLSQMATDVPSIREHPLFLKWFDGPPKTALYERIMGYDQDAPKESDTAKQ